MQPLPAKSAPEFDLEDEVIVRAEAELQDGKAVTVGILKVTLEHFIFESTGALDIVLGCAGVKVPIEDVRDAEYRTEEKTLIVRTDSERWHFAGRHIPEISGRLQDYLAELRDEPNEAQARAEEYEFLHDLVDLYEDETQVGEGKIRVTDNRLSLTPVSTEDAVLDAYGFDVPIDQIGDFWMNSIHSRLQVDIGGRRFDLGGPATPMVHEAVCELLGTDPEDSLVLSSRERAEVHRAKLPRFLWTYRGQLSIGTHAVCFEPTGVMKKRIDPDDHEIAWSEICAISIGGWPTKKLVVRGRAASFALQIKNLQHRYMDLVKTTFMALSEQDKVARRSLALFILDSWKKTIRWAKEDVIVFCDAAIRTDKTDCAITGAIVLTRGHAIFLPSAGPDGEDSPVKLAIASVKRVALDVADTIIFEAKGSTYRIRPASGQPFVQSFWSRCQAPTKTVEESEMRTRYMPRLIGETRSVRLFNQGQLVDAQRPGHAVAHPDGWAVVLRLDKLEFFQRLLPISVEVGQMEGVYQFDTRTLRLAPVPGHLRNLDHDKYRMLIAELPTSARMYNQRQALRRPLEGMPISAKQMSQASSGKRRRARSFEAYIHDISTGGASISTTHPLTTGQLVRIKLRLEDHIITPEARVSRSMPGVSGTGRTFGLQFEGISPQEENSIFQAVQTWQRADASSRFE